MKFKSGSYTGEKYSDGSLRIWKDKKIVCEFYVCVSSDKEPFERKQFESLVRAIEKNCKPYGGMKDEQNKEVF